MFVARSGPSGSGPPPSESWLSREASHGRTGSTANTGSSSLPPKPVQPAQPSQDKTIPLKTFSTEESVDNYLTSLAADLAIISEKPTTIFKSEGVDPVESLTKALEVLQTTVSNLADVQNRATRHVDFVTEEMESHEKTFLSMLDETDTAMESASVDFRAMDLATSGLVAAATTTGTRLATAHRVTASARTTLSMLQHMWDFSRIDAGRMQHRKELKGSLDAVFIDDSRLSEAAALVTTMLPLARELHSSNRRLGLASEELDDGKAGTVEAALRNLIAYRNQLENRLAMRFVDACNQEPSDYKTMAKCCQNLSHFDAEAVAVKSYIALMTLFSQSNSLHTPLPWTAAGQVEARTFALHTALQEMLDVIQREKGIFARIFPKWQEALETMVIRIIEEKAETVVTAALAPPDMELFPDTAERIQILDMYLSMLQPMHSILRNFRDEIENELPLSSSAYASLEGLITILTSNYPSVEQTWLALQWKLFQDEHRMLAEKEESKEVAAAAAAAEEAPDPAADGSGRGIFNGGFKRKVAAAYLKAGVAAVRARIGPSTSAYDEQATVDPNEVNLYIGWHKKVIRRASQLLPPASVTHHVSACFHKKAPNLPPCCLLDQVLTHSLAGLSATTRRSAATLKGPLVIPGVAEGGQGAGTTAGSRLAAGSVVEAAETCVAAGVRTILISVAHTEKVVDAVHRHFSESVQPKLTPRSAAVLETAHAKEQFNQVLERNVEVALEGLLEGVETVMSKTLTAEQKKADFLPAVINTDRLDQPTVPCLMVVGLVKAVKRECEEHLRSASIAPFLAAVGSILKEALLQHMLRFKFNDFGALQWKRDVAEYQAAAASFGLPSVDEAFDQFMLLTNTLIVPPASLPEVVDELSMDRAVARRYVALREDYTTARVDGKPLSVLLGDVGTVAPAPAKVQGTGAAMRNWMGSS